MAYALALLGVLSVLIGVAFVYWPAALILGGLLAVGVGVMLIDWKPQKQADR